MFAAPAPAASAALAGLTLASVVAYANVTSSAQLAALFPRARWHLRVHARERLGQFWGFLVG